jgi:O-antigen biosynthesis protein
VKNTIHKSYTSQIESADEDLSAIGQQLAGFEYLPKMSILLVVSDSDEVWIKRSVESVLNQLYPNVELCICDNASERPHVKEALEEVAEADNRVKVCALREPENIERAYNQALYMTTGDFVALLGQGDELSPVALFWVAELLQHVEADVIYSDEDFINISNIRSNLVLKPHWSPDLLLSTGYIGRLCVLRKDAVSAAGDFEENLGVDEEHALLLRIAEKTERFHHLPRVLYHRRFYHAEPAYEQPEHKTLLNTARKALEREGTRASLQPGITPDSVRVVRDLLGEPTVSVVALASKGAPTRYLENLERDTSYPIHETVVAEIEERLLVGGQTANVFEAQGANAAADEATGEYLLFISGYTKPNSSDWLTELLREAQRDKVGSVGCRVLNGDGSIRHAGTLLDLNGLAGSPSGSNFEDESRFRPVLDYPFNPYMVTIEGMMIRKSTFEEMGGFDEDHLPTALYDIDLSLRMREKGMLNVRTPYASLICEGAAQAFPSAGEIEYMWTRWWSELVTSFFYGQSPLQAIREGIDSERMSLVSTQ